MLLPPDDSETEPYDVPRGTCPTCGSGDVAHLIIGMPASFEDTQSGPDWVHWVGCIPPGYDRRCHACDATWEVHPL